jgi:hypothetical protein
MKRCTITCSIAGISGLVLLAIPEARAIAVGFTLGFVQFITGGAQ